MFKPVTPTNNFFYLFETLNNNSYIVFFQELIYVHQKNNEPEKDTQNLKKCSKLNRKTKTMTTKLNERKRIAAQNFYIFCDL